MDSRKELTGQVIGIITEQLGLEPPELEKVTDPDAKFTNDLDADSLDIVELVMKFEEEFSIDIPDDEAEGITTVGKAIDLIEAKLSAKALA